FFFRRLRNLHLSRHQSRAVFRSKRLISSSSAESLSAVKTAGSCQRVEKAGRCYQFLSRIRHRGDENGLASDRSLSPSSPRDESVRLADRTGPFAGRAACSHSFPRSCI